MSNTKIINFLDGSRFFICQYEHGFLVFTRVGTGEKVLFRTEFMDPDHRHYDFILAWYNA